MKRRPIIIVALLLLALMAAYFLTRSGSTSNQVLSETTMQPTTPSPTPSPSPSPTATPAPSPVPTPSPVPAAGLPAIGLAAGSSLGALDDQALAARLDAITADGFRLVRFDVEWRHVERVRGVYDWSPYDRIVREVTRRGLTPLVILTYAPGWAAGNPDCNDSQLCSPADTQAYGRFAGAAAARYAPLGVRHWELWNEPNSRDYFQPRADPGRYTAMLKSAYPAIKRVDPGSTVITGGLSPAGTDDWYRAPDVFLREIYAAGAQGYFDAVGHHPYTYPASPRTVSELNAWGQMHGMHALMSARGDGHKKIWLTEFGFPTGGPGPVAAAGFPEEASAEYVSEDQQARFAADAISLHRTFPWAGPLLWYSYIDDGTTPETNENFFGLRRQAGDPKPALDVLRPYLSRR